MGEELVKWVTAQLQEIEAEKYVSVAPVRAKVKYVLSNPSFAANAKRIGEKMPGYGGAAEAARLI